MDTARRELLEETGYAAREWHALVDSYASPGYHQRADQDLPGPRP